MAQQRVELVGGPAARKGTVDLVDGQPPREVSILLEQGPPIRTEEAGNLPGVRTYAVYVFHQVDDEGVAVYAYSHQGTVQ